MFKSLVWRMGVDRSSFERLPSTLAAVALTAVCVIASPAAHANTELVAPGSFGVEGQAMRTPVHPQAVIQPKDLGGHAGHAMEVSHRDPVVLPQQAGNVLAAIKAPGLTQAQKEDALFTSEVDEEAEISAAVMGVLGTGIKYRHKSTGVGPQALPSATFAASGDGDRHLGGKNLDQLGLFSGPTVGAGQASMFGEVEAAQRLGSVGKGITALTEESRSGTVPEAAFAEIEPAAGKTAEFLDESRSVRRKMVKQGEGVSTVLAKAEAATPGRTLLRKVSITVDPATVWGRNQAVKPQDQDRFSPSTESRFGAGPLFGHFGKGVDKGFNDAGHVGMERPQMSKAKPCC